MRLPNATNAKVERAKISEYLLNTSHPDGRTKAAFFLSFGFQSSEWHMLAAALKEVGESNPVSSVVESPYGRRYTVDGPLKAPDGKTPQIRTVWILESDDAPRLVTAYPL